MMRIADATDTPSVQPLVPNGHQLRADETRGRLLQAAEEIFAKEGFEAAQLSTIAKAANRTKGAIYGQFASKDDLFLALYEHHSSREMERLSSALAKCGSKEESLSKFKEFVLGLAKDKTWSLLTLEFKLYAARHPESQDRLTSAHRSTRVVGRDLFEQKVYGRLALSERKELETAAAAIRPIISALLLEAVLEADILSEKRLARLLSQIFDLILTPGK